MPGPPTTRPTIASRSCQCPAWTTMPHKVSPQRHAPQRVRVRQLRRPDVVLPAAEKRRHPAGLLSLDHGLTISLYYRGPRRQLTSNCRPTASATGQLSTEPSCAASAGFPAATRSARSSTPIKSMGGACWRWPARSRQLKPAIRGGRLRARPRIPEHRPARVRQRRCHDPSTHRSHGRHDARGNRTRGAAGHRGAGLRARLADRSRPCRPACRTCTPATRRMQGVGPEKIGRAGHRRLGARATCRNDAGGARATCKPTSGWRAESPATDPGQR